MTRMFLIAWPETRAVPEVEIRRWAMDAIANDEIDGPEHLNTEALAHQLNTEGLITWFGGIEEEPPLPGYRVPYVYDDDLMDRHERNGE